MNPNRLERINSEIHKALASIFANDLRDPRLVGIINIIAVDTTNDLSHCKVKISIFNTDEKTSKESFRTLQHSAGFVRKLLASKVDLRIVPELHFLWDTGLQDSARINQLLSSLNIPEEEKIEE